MLWRSEQFTLPVDASIDSAQTVSDKRVEEKIDLGYERGELHRNRHHRKCKLCFRSLVRPTRSCLLPGQVATPHESAFSLV